MKTISQKTIEFWDNFASGYDELAAKYQENTEKVIQSTLKYMDPNFNVMDYACGTGIFTLAIAGKVEKILAVDISSKMLEIAKNKALKDNTKNIRFLQASIFDVSFEKSTFDAICMFNTIHFIKDIDGLFVRISQLLKPGGLFILTYANRFNKPSFKNTWLKLKMLIGLLPVLRGIGIERMKKIISRNGFNILEIEIINQEPPMYFISANTKKSI